MNRNYRVDNSKKRCVVCGSYMWPYISTYYICRHCKYMTSDLSPGSGAEVDGITSVRINNYKTICNIIKSKFFLHKTILDIGCSNGLFLSVAQNELSSGQNFTKLKRTMLNIAEKVSGVFHLSTFARFFFC